MATRVRLHAVSGSIVVRAEPRDDVDAGPKAKVAVTGDGTMEIKGARPSSNLHVAVPLGADIAVGTVSGGIELVGPLGDVRATSKSGSIEVEQADTTDLRTVSGSIQVGKCDGLCRASNKSGQVVVTEAGEAEVSSVSGRVRIEADSHVAVRTVSGTVDLHSGGRGPIRVQTVSGSIEVELPAGVKPNVRLTRRGSVRGSYEAGDDVEIEICTVSGKITIDAG